MSDSTFPNAETCHELNLNAVLYPVSSEDDTPCIQVAGIQAYLYLDAESKKVRVAIDLGGTQPWVVRPDGTVPLEVVVGNTVVFDK